MCPRLTLIKHGHRAGAGKALVMEKYKFIPKTKVVDRINAVLELARAKNVLHIGMGGFVDDNDLTTRVFLSRDLTQKLHGQLSNVVATLTGLDINPETIRAMRECVPGEYFVGDITDPGLPEKIGRKFEVILFPEVIEHLDCFRSALQNIRNLLENDGYVVITTTSAYGLESIIKMLFRYESVHDEHTSYFSYLTMKRLLDMNGFEIERFLFTLQRRRAFLSAFSVIGYYTLVVVSKILPQYAQGLLFVARPVRRGPGD